MRVSQSRRSTVARERGLTLWRERDDLVIAAAYRVAPPGKIKGEIPANPPLKFAPQA
jgi:hypothetical protein